MFYGRVELVDLLARYGEPVARYGAILQEIGGSQEDLKARLVDQEKDARMNAEAEPEKGLSHTSALLASLSAEGDWVSLREHAARHLESPDRTVAVQAKRMLALGLAHSTENMDRVTAADLYRSLAKEGLAEPSDVRNLATVLVNVASFEEAKVVLLNGMRDFEAKASGGFYDIGLKIVAATGDREFRKQLEAAIAARGKRD